MAPKKLQNDKSQNGESEDCFLVVFIHSIYCGLVLCILIMYGTMRAYCRYDCRETMIMSLFKIHEKILSVRWSKQAQLL